MPSELNLTLRNDLRDLIRVQELATGFLAAKGLSERTEYATNLALEEVLSNVIRHGFADTLNHEISVAIRIDQGIVEIVVVDDGREFNPVLAPEVNIEAPIDERQVGGLGIHLVKKMARAVEYNRTDGKNHLRVRV